MFHFGKGFPGDACPCHQNQVHRVREFALMQPERLAQESAGPIAHHGISHLPAGDDPQTGRRADRQTQPVGDQAAVGDALPCLPCSGEIASVLNARPATQAEALRRRGHGIQAGVSRLRPERRRLARMARPLLVRLRARNPC